MDKADKGIIIGTFVKHAKILPFLDFLKNKLSIKLDKVYVFEVSGNDGEYLVTFSSPRKNSYLDMLHDATLLHTKNGCLFSINALNLYINKKNTKGLPNKDFNIDWNELKDCLMVTTNGNLKICTLKKVKIC